MDTGETCFSCQRHHCRASCHLRFITIFSNCFGLTNKVFLFSLSIFIPVSVLWTIQISGLQWFLCGVAFLLSSGVLVFALWNNSVKDSGVRKNFGFVLIAVVIALHLLLALGFMLYFFHVPNAHETGHGGNMTAVPAVPTPSKQVQEDLDA